MRILFWNLNGNDLKSYIEACLYEHDIDIAIFSEHKGVVFFDIEKHTNYRCIEGMGGCEKIIMLAKKTIEVDVKQEQSRYVLYQVADEQRKYIVAGIHLQDKFSTDSAVRIACSGRMVNDIGNLEKRSKCNNTIIIGDFNANPYDDEMLQMNSFNATLFKDVIKKSETRIVDGVSYRRFYNPTINFISEATKNYGSFYYTNGSNTPIWHCIDQVLVSKNLVDSVMDFKYLKFINKKSLLKAIRPNQEISDHLPLLVEII